MDNLLQNEPLLRIGIMLSVFASMAIWEVAAPRRSLTIKKHFRWANNLMVVVVDSVLLRITFPAAAVGIAAFAQQQSWGLSSVLNWPAWFIVLLSILILDFFIWVQHVLFHAVPIFWRLHRMHHTDQDIDVTTGLRFHPIEILLSMLIKGAVIITLGAPPEAVLIFEVLLNATAMFNHSNVRLPRLLDTLLRALIVTPDMHRVHHSWYPNETNSNYGFNLSIWDRLFGTYIAQPQDGHEGMTIGIETFRELKDQRIDRMLVQPFMGASGNYPINRRMDRG